MAKKPAKKARGRPGKGRTHVRSPVPSAPKPAKRRPAAIKPPSRKPKKSAPAKSSRKKPVPLTPKAERRGAKIIRPSHSSVQPKTSSGRAGQNPAVKDPGRSSGQPLSPEQAVFIDSCELPVRYDRTGVTLIARDPQSVYAYWEITPTTLREAQSKLGAAFKNAVRTIRMFNITGIDFNGANAISQFDVDVGSKIQSRYIVLPNDNATLCAFLGFRTRAGAFYPVAQSNYVSTPSADVSDCSEITWAKVTHKQGAKPLVVGQTFLPSAPRGQAESSGRQAGDRREHRHADAPLGDMAGAGRTEKSGPDADTARACAPGEPEQGANQAGAGRTEKPGPDADTARACTPGEPEQGENQTGAGRIGERPAADPAQALAWRQETGAMEMTMDRATSPVFTEENSWFSGDIMPCSSAVFGGASERMTGQRDFNFHINAELVVFGRTEPGARVTMDGREIELRGDGTFTRRLAFPEGVLPLDFCARPADGSAQKTITLTVGKTTFVHP